MRLIAALAASVLVAAPVAAAYAQPAMHAESANHRAGDEPGKGDRTGVDRSDPAAKQVGEDKISPADIATAPIARDRTRNTHHHQVTIGRAQPIRLHGYRRHA